MSPNNGTDVKGDISPNYVRIWQNSEFCNLSKQLLFK